MKNYVITRFRQRRALNQQSGARTRWLQTFSSLLQRALLEPRQFEVTHQRIFLSKLPREFQGALVECPGETRRHLIEGDRRDVRGVPARQIFARAMNVGADVVAQYAGAAFDDVHMYILFLPPRRQERQGKTKNDSCFLLVFFLALLASWR